VPLDHEGMVTVWIGTGVLGNVLRCAIWHISIRWIQYIFITLQIKFLAAGDWVELTSGSLICLVSSNVNRGPRSLPSTSFEMEQPDVLLRCENHVLELQYSALYALEPCAQPAAVQGSVSSCLMSIET